MTKREEHTSKKSERVNPPLIDELWDQLPKGKTVRNKETGQLGLLITDDDSPGMKDWFRYG
jgi:hypothetical protein